MCCEPLSLETREGIPVPGGVRERDYPAYPLDEVVMTFKSGRFKVTRRVQRHLERRGWGVGTVCHCVCGLRPDDFYKSQAHRTEPGVWLDIYKPNMGAERLYVKFAPQSQTSEYVVLSFCGDGEPH